MTKKILRIHYQDNVLVALQDLYAGEEYSIDGQAIKIQQDIPAKHKVLMVTLNPGDKVTMYGITVGKALSPILAGAAITTSNVKHQASEYSGKSESTIWKVPDISRWKDKTFLGFHRSDGQVGTANYWIVIPLVFCENSNVETIRQAFESELGFAKGDHYQKFVQQLVTLYHNNQFEEIKTIPLRPASANGHHRLFKNVDGIKFLTHQGGCGGTRQDAEALCKLLAGYINNPNVAGATILSLGCQNAQVEILQEKIKEKNPSFDKPIIVLEQQQAGTEEDLLAQAIRETFLGLVEADKQERQPAPLNKLVVGLECGGSDGFSGISANPSVGHASDLIVALGGTTILSEFPELCGVEQELINRCIDTTTANRFIEFMRAYEHAAKKAGSGFDMNPSPGNIKDGLITDAMKSAGAAKKGGTSPITDVIDYGDYVKRAGLNLLCTPGNDVESTTAMAGSGANIILFTTGLGTPTGNPITPVIKISSNTRLAQRMPDIIDTDTGSIIAGNNTIETMGEQILEYIIDVASGKPTKAMLLHQNDFIPWKRGVSL